MINYLLLMKPGILIGNLITMAAGFSMGKTGGETGGESRPFDFPLFIATTLGLGLIMASGCVFNNLFDKAVDQKMKRTQNRPIPRGSISKASATLYGILLLLLGNGLLFSWTNPLVLAAADIGFVIYVLLYTFLKKQSVYATFIGSIAGAIPPVVGYLAATNRLDMGAALLFLTLVFWQMAHFYSIALFRLEDYRAADIPVLPLVTGVFRTRIHIILYIIAFMITASFLTFAGYTRYGFLALLWVMGSYWLYMALQGLQTSTPILWARQMFRISLVTLCTISLLILFE